MKWLLGASFLVLFAGSAKASVADCVLEIDHVRFIDGKCSFQKGEMPKEFVIRRFHINDSLEYIARLETEDDGTNVIYWNKIADTADTSESLGPMTQHGACWANDHAKLCAWKWGERRGAEWNIQYETPVKLMPQKQEEPQTTAPEENTTNEVKPEPALSENINGLAVSVSRFWTSGDSYVKAIVHIHNASNLELDAMKVGCEFYDKLHQIVAADDQYFENIPRDNDSYQTFLGETPPNTSGEIYSAKCRVMSTRFKKTGGASASADTITIQQSLQTKSTASSDDESKFIAIISDAKTSYSKSTTEFESGSVRPERKEKICALMTTPYVTDWKGTITEISTNGDGYGVLYVDVADGIHIGTMNNSFSDSIYHTLIRPSEDVYKALKTLSVGSKIKFSGQFFKSDSDCIAETSITLDGSITDPDFVFRFFSVSLQ